MQDVIAGQVEMSFAAVSNAQSLKASGKLKALGVTSAKRLGRLPDVPAIAEVFRVRIERLVWPVRPRENAPGPGRAPQRHCPEGDAHARGAPTARTGRRERGRQFAGRIRQLCRVRDSSDGPRWSEFRRPIGMSSPTGGACRGWRSQTLAQKLIARAAGRTEVMPGDIVECRIDLAMFHDSSGPRRLKPMLEELGAKIWDRSRVVLVTDHYVPEKDEEARKILRMTREWAASRPCRIFTITRASATSCWPSRATFGRACFASAATPIRPRAERLGPACSDRRDRDAGRRGPARSGCGCPLRWRCAGPGGCRAA